MATKHDGKRAQANMWVTHQNLARAKGARPFFTPKARKPVIAAKPTAASSVVSTDDQAAAQVAEDNR